MCQALAKKRRSKSHHSDTFPVLTDPALLSASEEISYSFEEDAEFTEDADDEDDSAFATDEEVARTTMSKVMLDLDRVWDAATQRRTSTLSSGPRVIMQRSPRKVIVKRKIRWEEMKRRTQQLTGVLPPPDYLRI